MSCSSAASLYIQCVDRARQVNYTPRDMSLIQNTDWEKGWITMNYSQKFHVFPG